MVIMFILFFTLKGDTNYWLLQQSQQNEETILCCCFPLENPLNRQWKSTVSPRLTVNTTQTIILDPTARPDGLPQPHQQKRDFAWQAALLGADLSVAHHPGGDAHFTNRVWQRHGSDCCDHKPSPEGTPELVFSLSGLRRHSGFHLSDALFLSKRTHGLLVLWHSVVWNPPGFGCSLLHFIHRSPVRHKPGQVLVCD